MSEAEILAEESYRELLKLLDWFSLHGPLPTLIGGWAVFVYNSYAGSVDIDLVGPSMKGQFLDLIERFERVHKYEGVKRGPLGVERTFRKSIIKNEKPKGYVEIDVCTFESNAASFHENLEKKLPYALCGDLKLIRKVALNEKCEVYVPRKCLLFLYKLKALRDRAFDLKTKGVMLGAERRIWLQSKLIKDGSDLIALLDPDPRRYIIKENLDFHLLKQLIEKHDLYFALESIKELPNKKESLDKYMNINQNKVKKWVKNLFDNL